MRSGCWASALAPIRFPATAAITYLIRGESTLKTISAPTQNRMESMGRSPRIAGQERGGGSPLLYRRAISVPNGVFDGGTAAPGAPHDSAGAASAPKPPEISDDARALAEIVKRRYGQHLTAEQLESVTKEIENRLQGGKALRAAKLANSDEPDFVFRA